MPGAPEAFCLTEPQSPLVFTARSYGDFSSWHWNPGLGGLIWGWDTSLLRGKLHSQDIHPDFYPPHVGMGPALSVSLPFPPVLMWLLLFKKIYLFTFREREREGKRNIDLLFHLFMPSLVASCMSPDRASNPQPWSIRTIL